jgi:proton-dependent oligopeptide transporter, POT family
MNDLSEARGERSRTLGFVTLFLIEMWERFGYYGMTAVVVLYMVQQLSYGDDRANLTFGAFVALAYAIPAAGGFIGDKLLGSRRTLVIGALVLACGYSLLAIPDRPSLLFPALALIAVGGGVFKANPASLISRLYEGDSAKIDSAFTMYYMAVNVGATLSQIATPLIALAIGWHAAFAVCAAGLVLGLLNYFFMRRFLAHVGSKSDFEPLDLRRLVLVLVGIAVGTVCVAFIIQNRDVARALVVLAFLAMFVIFGWMMKHGSDRERKGLWAVIILTAEAMLFFIFYQQMSTSLTLFSLRNVDLNVFGYQVPAGQVQALNPIWIFILSPPLAWLYNRLGKKGGDFHISTKFTIGFAILAFGFFLYGLSGRFAHGDGKVSFSWMVAGYLFQSLGELLISGLGLAVYARYVKPSLRGFLMGVYFLSTGISQYLGSFVATYASVPEGVTSPVQSLPLYTNLFLKLGFVAIVGTIIAAVLVPLMKRLPEAGVAEEQARVAPVAATAGG